MTRVFPIDAWHGFSCHGYGGCKATARYEVLTELSQHTYCRDHLPRRYRALVGLGTAVSEAAMREAKLLQGVR